MKKHVRRPVRRPVRRSLGEGGSLGADGSSLSVGGNRIIMAVLAASLLGSQPIMAAEPSRSMLVDRAKNEYRAFKEAIRCARKEGISKCTPAQKKRVFIAGVALVAAIAWIG